MVKKVEFKNSIVKKELNKTFEKELHKRIPTEEEVVQQAQLLPPVKRKKFLNKYARSFLKAAAATAGVVAVVGISYGLSRNIIKRDINEIVDKQKAKIDDTLSRVDKSVAGANKLINSAGTLIKGVPLAKLKPEDIQDIINDVNALINNTSTKADTLMKNINTTIEGVPLAKLKKEELKELSDELKTIVDYTSTKISGTISDELGKIHIPFVGGIIKKPEPGREIPTKLTELQKQQQEQQKKPKRNSKKAESGMDTSNIVGGDVNSPRLTRSTTSVQEPEITVAKNFEDVAFGKKKIQLTVLKKDLQILIKIK